MEIWSKVDESSKTTRETECFHPQVISKCSARAAMWPTTYFGKMASRDARTPLTAPRARPIMGGKWPSSTLRTISLTAPCRTNAACLRRREKQPWEQPCQACLRCCCRCHLCICTLAVPQIAHPTIGRYATCKEPSPGCQGCQGGLEICEQPTWPPMYGYSTYIQV